MSKFLKVNVHNAGVISYINLDHIISINGILNKENNCRLTLTNNAPH